MIAASYPGYLPLTTSYPLLVNARRLTRQVVALPGGYLLRNGFRTAQTWWHYRQFRQLRELLARPAMSQLKNQYPRLAYKYLSHCLLANSLPATRLAIIGHHYGQLARLMRPDFFDRLLRQQHPLWQEQAGSQVMRMTLAYPTDSDFEGELALLFYVDKTLVYTVTCTFAPGAALGAPFPAVLLVSRVQGTRNFAFIKQVTKQLHDSTPAAMLIQGLVGLALACGIRQVVGINTAAQPNAAKVDNQFDYNGFWQQLGATPMPSGLYLLPVPLPEKPIEAIKANHRARTLRKRQYKQTVRESVRQTVAQQLLAGRALR